jgi:hypothetical protein
MRRPAGGGEWRPLLIADGGLSDSLGDCGSGNWGIRGIGALNRRLIAKL